MWPHAELRGVVQDVPVGDRDVELRVVVEVQERAVGPAESPSGWPKPIRSLPLINPQTPLMSLSSGRREQQPVAYGRANTRRLFPATIPTNCFPLFDV